MAYSAKTFKGIKKKNLEKKAFGDAVFVPKTGILSVQFLDGPDQWDEYYTHIWQEGATWKFVPCTMEEDCELCNHEDSKIKRQNYQFAAHILNIDEKKVQILTGPKALAARLFAKFERSEETASGSFVKRVWDLSRLEDAGYDVERSEKKAINPKGMSRPDIDKYLEDQMNRYYGDNKPSVEELVDDVPAEDEWEKALDSVDVVDPEEDFSDFESDDDDFPDFEDEPVEEKPRARKKV